jgi:hypothetical protein
LVRIPGNIDLGVDGKIILKQILRECVGRGWIVAIVHKGAER